MQVILINVHTQNNVAAERKFLDLLRQKMTSQIQIYDLQSKLFTRPLCLDHAKKYKGFYVSNTE
jgi:hypothetical protein